MNKEAMQKKYENLLRLAEWIDIVAWREEGQTTVYFGFDIHDPVADEEIAYIVQVSPHNLLPNGIWAMDYSNSVPPSDAPEVVEYYHSNQLHEFFHKEKVSPDNRLTILTRLIDEYVDMHTTLFRSYLEGEGGGA